MNTLKYLALSLITPSLAFAFAPTYTLHDLGLLPGSTQAEPLRMIDRGDTVGLAIGDNYKGVLFHRGTVIDVLPTATQSYSSDINAASHVSGYFYTGTKWSGFTYSNGHVSTFNAPSAIETTPESLNDIGQVAGEWMDSAFNGHIFIRQANGSYSDLGIVGSSPSALAINNQGRVLIGTYDTPRDHTYITRPGSTSMEEVPSLVSNGGVSPGDMNQFSVVTGGADVGKHFHAYAYCNGRIKDIGGLRGADDSFGWGINNLGQIVGESIVEPKTIKDANGNVIKVIPGSQSGFVDVDGTLRDVNKLMDASGKGWVISRAQSINDLGRITAFANLNSGPQHAVELTPNCVLPNLVP